MADGIAAAAEQTDPGPDVNPGQRVHGLDINSIDDDTGAVAHANAVAADGTNVAVRDGSSRGCGAVEGDPTADPSRHRTRRIDVEARDAQVRLTRIDGRPGDRVTQGQILDYDRGRCVRRNPRAPRIVRDER